MHTNLSDYLFQFELFHSTFTVLKYLEKREFEENKLRELQDQFSELRKIEQSLVRVHEIFLNLSTSVMKQVSHNFVTLLKWNFVLNFFLFGILHVNKCVRRKHQSDELKTLFGIQKPTWKPQ